MRNRTMTGFLGLMAVATLTAGCAGASAPDAATDTSADEAETEVVEEGEVRTLRVAHIYTAEHPVESCGIPAVQEALAGTGLEVESFPAGQLGSENEIVEQVLDGSLDFAFAGAAFLGQYEENFAVLDAPFVYRDVDHFYEATQGPIFDTLAEGLRAESGLDVFATWYYGTRHLTSNFAVTNADDMAGIKLRVPDAPLYLTAAEILGGVGTPVAFAELYTSLQQGVVDAQENPIPTINDQSFFEVQDYINLTGHMISGVYMTSSDAVTATMDDEQLVALRAAALAGAQAAGACIEEQEASFLEAYESEGTMMVNRDVDTESFQERAAEIIPGSGFPWIDFYLEIQSS